MIAILRRIEASNRVNERAERLRSAYRSLHYDLGHTLLEDSDWACREAVASKKKKNLLSRTGACAIRSSPSHRFFGRRVYFFRRRLAFATARRYHGANIETAVALPPLEMSVSPVAAAASAFSLSIRPYSAGEHLFAAINSVRCVTVSHDANIRSVIIVGRDVLRRLRAFIMNRLRGGCRALLSNIFM
jgi:hypothetical protein